MRLERAASRLSWRRIKRGLFPEARPPLFLRSRLPEHMVPAQVFVLDSLPRLAGGKVDRRVLEAIAAAQPKIARSAGAPRTPAEIEVAGVFEKVLGITGVGSGDDFFELGGHSLGAVEALAEIRKRFPGAELSLLGFFKDSSVAGLARALGGSPAAAGEQAEEKVRAALVVLKPGGAGPPLFLIHPSGRSGARLPALAAALTTTGAVFGIVSRGAAGPAFEHLTIEAMADGICGSSPAERGRRAHTGWPGGPWAAPSPWRSLRRSREAGPMSILSDSWTRLFRHSSRTMRTRIFPRDPASALDPELPADAFIAGSARRAEFAGGLAELYRSLAAIPAGERAERVVAAAGGAGLGPRRDVPESPEGCCHAARKARPAGRLVHPAESPGACRRVGGGGSRDSSMRACRPGRADLGPARARPRRRGITGA